MDDFHLYKVDMEVQEILFLCSDKLYTFDVAATVDEQKGKGEKVPPSQTTPAKPPHILPRFAPGSLDLSSPCQM